MTRRVLLVDDDREVRDALGQSLELADLQPLLAASFVEAKDHIAPAFDGVVVSDIRMPGRDGFHLLAYVQGIDPELPVILLTGEGDIPMAVDGMSSGAFDFLEKPCPTDRLLAAVEKALKTRGLVLENRRLAAALQSDDAAARMLWGHSALAEEMRTQVRAVAPIGATVLITGAPGSGTAKVAEVVHLLSRVADGPFIQVTGAGQTARSLDEAMRTAQGGTLYVDEIAALPVETQFSALSLIEEHPKTRLVAGTCRDLDAEMRGGLFNADLFYKLDVLRVRIPALRERAEDIPVLFRQYVRQAAERAALPVPDIPPALLARLMAQDWPGNARALMNAATRFVMGLGDGEATSELGLAEQLAQVERALLAEALRRHGGNASETARALKLPRKTFYDKLARHGLRAEDYRVT